MVNNISPRVQWFSSFASMTAVAKTTKKKITTKISNKKLNVKVRHDSRTHVYKSAERTVTTETK